MMISITPKTLVIGQQSVAYTLRRHRRARRVTLRVDDQGLTVIIPWSLPLPRLEAFLETKRDWIVATVNKYAGQQAVTEWQDGDRILLLGSYRRLCYRAGTPRIVLVSDDIIMPQFLANQATAVGIALEKWMVALARRVLSLRVEQLAPLMGVHPERITIRNQKTRWGSCSGRGTISLNWRLIMATSEVADYVIVHELAHLQELNHSQRFWAIVAQHDRSYQEHRLWLRQNGHQLAWPPKKEASQE